MIIEICGLPGVGKTTLVKKLSNQTGFSRVMVVNVFAIIFYFSVGAVRHPIYFAKGFIFWFQHSRSVESFWNVFMYRYSRYGKADVTKEKICVLDEGPQQGLYSYVRRLGKTKIMQDYLDIVPKPDFVVIISLEEHTRQEQILKRKKLQPNRKSETNEEKEVLLEADNIFQKLAVKSPRYQVVGSIEEAYDFIKKLNYE